MSEENQIKILIIEDVEDIRLLLKEILNVKGYKIDVASDGEQALKKIDSVKYNLIITDVLMPVRDGFDVVKTMKNTQGLNQNTPVIAISGGGSVMEAETALGAIDFYVDSSIKKPFKSQKIIDEVDNLLMKTTT